MTRSRYSKVKPFLRRRSVALARAGIVGTCFAVIGVLLLQLGSAATYTTVQEVESATAAGQASPIAATNASAGAAMFFGTKTPDAPTNLVAYTGGDSIALRWDIPIDTFEVANAVKSYEVYRNGSLLKTVTAEQHTDFIETNGTGTIDAAVTKGTTYSYQVRTVTKAGGRSPLSTALSVLHSTTSFPTPTITVDTSRAPELAGHINTVLVPYMKTWYPKIAMQTALPKFTPPSTFKIELNTIQPNGAAVNGYNWWRTGQGAVSLLIHPTWLRENPSVHIMPLMASYVMQARPNAVTAPTWVSWSAGYWATYSMQRFNGQVRAPQAGQRYDDLYQPTAQFMEYLRVKYNPDIVKLINAAVVANNYSDTLFVQYTGKTLAQLQAEWQPTPPKGPGLIKFSAYANKCLDNDADGGKTHFGPQVWDCNSTPPQLWSAYYQTDGSFALRSVKNCLHAGEDESGIRLGMASCRGTTTSLWKQGANGALISQSYTAEARGKCLEVTNGNTANGTQLTLATCNGSNKQLFSPVPK